jgi:hypothetical protein
LLPGVALRGDVTCVSRLSAGKGSPMKARLASALALSLAFTQLVAMPAYAEQSTAQFRTVAPQTFSAADLQAYGLSASQTDRATALQADGYRIMVLTPEEAKAYQAGITDNQWLLIGILAAVIVIAVAVGGD